MFVCIVNETGVVYPMSNFGFKRIFSD